MYVETVSGFRIKQLPLTILDTFSKILHDPLIFPMSQSEVVLGPVYARFLSLPRRVEDIPG